MRIFSLGRVFLLACGLSEPRFGGLLYAADAPSYTGSVGSIVPVSIYLQETLTGASTSYISNVGGGLTGAGAAVNIVGTTGGTAASFGTSNTMFTTASTFGNAATAPGTLVYNQGTGAVANNLEFLQNITNTQSTVQPTADATGDRVLLGVLNVQIGSGTTTYNLTSLANDTINNSNTRRARATETRQRSCRARLAQTSTCREERRSPAVTPQRPTSSRLPPLPPRSPNRRRWRSSDSEPRAC